mmetsp:Transcript_157121/g.301463  ORF Transcript_157121/g.301463 Transcript_157121/m.301463 type:complete len:129 (+) Transcript_157121:530-916(+)
MEARVLVGSPVTATDFLFSWPLLHSEPPTQHSVMQGLLPAAPSLPEARDLTWLVLAPRGRAEATAASALCCAGDGSVAALFGLDTSLVDVDIARRQGLLVFLQCDWHASMRSVYSVGGSCNTKYNKFT